MKLAATPPAAARLLLLMLLLLPTFPNERKQSRDVRSPDRVFDDSIGGCHTRGDVTREGERGETFLFFFSCRFAFFEVQNSVKNRSCFSLFCLERLAAFVLAKCVEYFTPSLYSAETGEKSGCTSVFYVYINIMT